MAGRCRQSLLSAIGGKLARQALLDAIVMLSAAIGFGYESWSMDTTTNGTASGLLAEDTAERIVLKVDATQEIRLTPSAITRRRPIPISMMLRRGDAVLERRGDGERSRLQEVERHRQARRAREFVDGLALVQLEDTWCYIDPHGRIVARDVWDGGN